MNFRRIIIILGFFIFVVGAGLAIYFLFFRQPVESPGPNSNNTNGFLPTINNAANRNTSNTNGSITPIGNTNTGIQPLNGNTNASPVADGGVTQVSTVVQGSVKNPQVNTQSGMISYYDQDADKFYQMRSDGTGKQELSSQAFPEVQDIIWNKNSDTAVMTFPDESKIVYDFNSKKQYTLPKETEDFSFSPTGNQLAYKYLPSNIDDRSIIVSSTDGSGAKLVEELGDKANDVEIDWSPKGDVVARFRKSIDASRQEVFFVGQNKENYKSVIVEGRGFTGAWSPDGERLLYSVYTPETNYNPKLYLVNGSGEAIGTGNTDLNVATWPDKCVFTSGTNLYCAEPNYLPPGSGLRPDQVSDYNDTFYQINALTGQKQLLAQPSIPVNAKDLRLSSDGKTLYFIDAKTNRMQSIRLP